MKIGVLSDIHGNAIALDYAIEDLREQGITKVVILGDVVMKGPMPSEVIDTLKNSELDILSWIKGNTDIWFEEFSETYEANNDREKQIYEYYKFAKENLDEDKIAFINALPYEYSFSVNTYKILCVHGTPKSIVEAVDSTVPETEIRKAIEGVKEDIILSGHSHTSFIGEVDGKKIFNVGSIGNQLDGDNRISYGILDFTGDEVRLMNRRVSYPVDEIINMAEKREFPFLESYKDSILNA
ncbi:metallophosphoesterase family protein [Inconstantimicrobium mannanitabidum]|uniref:Serine/threonine protein phosphatase n=1 Tax=Inconstantimicrobium mannanitabidum TaxID=1604901 RepID=A0ACB5RFR8_9CLOT|nr:YfcE family phosphodiesterase [Clostridium sp. TW13]GKX67932.1 serine/threonine protein phosphatase [Clostridium sp. TW13]